MDAFVAVSTKTLMVLAIFPGNIRARTSLVRYHHDCSPHRKKDNEGYDPFITLTVNDVIDNFFH